MVTTEREGITRYDEPRPLNKTSMPILLCPETTKENISATSGGVSAREENNMAKRTHTNISSVVGTWDTSCTDAEKPGLSAMSCEETKQISQVDSPVLLAVARPHPRKKEVATFFWHPKKRKKRTRDVACQKEDDCTDSKELVQKPLMLSVYTQTVIQQVEEPIQTVTEQTDDGQGEISSLKEQPVTESSNTVKAKNESGNIFGTFFVDERGIVHR